MASIKVEEYIVAKMDALNIDNPIVEQLQTLRNYYVNQLWSQLSEICLQLIRDPDFIKFVDILELYENFIKDFERRIHPLQLVELVLPIAEFIFKRDKNEAFNFLETFNKKVEQDKRAFVRLHSGEAKLRLEDKQDTFVKNLLEEAKTKLDEIVEIGPVHAAYYKISAAYQHQIGNHALYYTEAMCYLCCEKLDQLSPLEKCELAVSVVIAAILGKNVYNFGELLAQPILASLRGTQKEWLIDLLESMNAGDWDGFQKYMAKFMSESPGAAENVGHVEEKLQLLCLMEMATKRPPKQRCLTFDEISKGAHVEKGNKSSNISVQLLVMKAMANGLIEGQIDGVGHLVHISWVQPRVLSIPQIHILERQTEEWRTSVDKQINQFKGDMPKLI